MTKNLPPLLIERVKHIHYGSPEYKTEQAIVVYNVCPLCGSVTRLQNKESLTSEIEAVSDSTQCKTCADVKFLHPTIYDWLLMMINHQEYIVSIENLPGGKVNNEEETTVVEAEKEDEEYIN